MDNGIFVLCSDKSHAQTWKGSAQVLVLPQQEVSMPVMSPILLLNLFTNVLLSIWVSGIIPKPGPTTNKTNSLLLPRLPKLSSLDNLGNLDCNTEM